jgi:hypothetical protein
MFDRKYRSGRGGGRIPQKKNPFNKIESWKKPWVAKAHAWDGVKVFH